MGYILGPKFLPKMKVESMQSVECLYIRRYNMWPKKLEFVCYFTVKYNTQVFFGLLLAQHPIWKRGNTLYE